jgi:hypothetical protein
MQNTPQSYWGNAAKAPNCVGLNSRSQANKFREACSFILKMQAEARGVGGKQGQKSDSGKPNQAAVDMLYHLGELRQKGIITEEEFNTKKGELLARL